MAVFQARAATRPKAVVMSVENLSRTSAVNSLSFGSFGSAVGLAVGSAVRHGAVFGVGPHEVLHGVRAPAHDHLLAVPVELGADVGLAADAAADVIPGGLARPAFQALGVKGPGPRPPPDPPQS